jgi:hypothetical protein
MKPRLYSITDPETSQAIQELGRVVSNLGAENFASVIIEGTLAANAEGDFKHNLGAIPGMILVQEGAVYVVSGSVNSTKVTLKNLTASQQTFKVRLIK